MLDTLRQDLRYGLRRLGRRPGSAALMMLTLALTIGAFSAVLTVARAVFLDPFPYHAHDRIVTMRMVQPTADRRRSVWSVPEYLDIAARDDVFEHTVAGRARDVNLTGADRPERVRAVAITAGAFPMLGVPPLLGRRFTERDDRPGADAVAVIGYDLWQRRYAGDPAAIGSTLEVEGHHYAIIGVMPRRFQWWGSQIWFPLQLDRTDADREAYGLTVQGRLRPGLDAAAAQARLDELAAGWARRHGAEIPAYRGARFQLDPLLETVIRDVRPALLSLLGAVALLFLIACANVASIQLTRTLSRRREFAVRRALGAGRGRIGRQLLVENMVLALIGGGLGLLLAVWAADAMTTLIPYAYFPAETVIATGPADIGWTLLVAAAGGLLLWAIPSAFLRRRGGTEADVLRGGVVGTGRSSRRTRAALVAAELALGLVVVVAAGLMLRSFDRLTAIDPGFRAAGLVSMRLDLPRDRYPELERAAFFEALQRRAAGLPGVEGAAISISIPLAFEGYPSHPITAEGEADRPPRDARYQITVGDYFATLGLDMVRGRGFDQRDRADGAPVAIVNQAFARRHFGEDDAVGRRIRRAGDDRFPWRTIVGVVGDVRHAGLDRESPPAYYVPYAQAPIRPADMALTLRGAGAPDALVDAARGAVAAMDPELPVFWVRTLDEIVADSTGGRRMAVVLLALFGALSLVLAGIGVFAVMGFSVRERSGEIGLRMAVGADPTDIARLVIGDSLRIAAVGIGVGILAAIAAARLLGGLVYGVATLDPATFVATIILFTTVAVAGAAIPALQARRVDPATALDGDRG